MKKFIAFSIIGLCLGFASPLWAEDGDVGTRECRIVQEMAITAVEDGEPFRNHGQLMKAAVNTVHLAEEMITGKCFSCIINQFARRIPIEQQVACGPLFDCTIDQQNDPSDINLTAGSSTNRFQEFVPALGSPPDLEQSLLCKVQLRTRNGTPSDKTATINIREGTPDGSILGSAMGIVPQIMGDGALVDFVFSNPLSLTVGNLYLIELIPTASPNNFSYLGISGDPNGSYPFGALWTDDSIEGIVINPLQDLNFNTFALE